VETGSNLPLESLLAQEYRGLIEGSAFCGIPFKTSRVHQKGFTYEIQKIEFEIEFTSDRWYTVEIRHKEKNPQMGKSFLVEEPIPYSIANRPDYERLFFDLVTKAKEIYGL